MLLALLISWCVSPAVAAGTLFFLAGAVLLPTLLPAVDLFRRPVDVPPQLHVREVLRAMGRPLARNALTFVFLPFEAYISADAITRTLARMGWTKGRLLEWRTASDSERGTNGGLRHTFRAMAAAPAVAAAALTRARLLPSRRVAGRGTVDCRVGRIAACRLVVEPDDSSARAATVRTPTPLSRETVAEDVAVLRGVRHGGRELAAARQHPAEPPPAEPPPAERPPAEPPAAEPPAAEPPAAEPPAAEPLSRHCVVVAPRTSPTNIGMALLADLAAHDFGYCSAARLLERVQHTVDTLSNMERHRGHYFNWYDTRSLAPMYPRYVSMVDSGNLAAHLLVLAGGLTELSTARVLPPRTFAGLCDTLRVLLEVARDTDGQLMGGEVLRKIERQIEDVQQAPSALGDANALLTRLTGVAAELTAGGGGATRSSRGGPGPMSGPAAIIRPICCTWRPGWPCPRPRRGGGSSVPTSGAMGSASCARRSRVWTRLPRWGTWRKRTRRRFRGWTPPCDAAPAATSDWFERLNAALAVASQRAATRIRTCRQVATQCRELAKMDFGLMYDSTRDLFAIGYNSSERRLDASYYDLLASEARLTSYLVVAQGHYSQSHWFALGRLLTSAGGDPALLSWSGSMFEYLMPLLVMPNYENTLLDRTYQAVVRRQIAYGRQRGVPWGMSESGYNAIDQYKTYQYRAFGVPGLGLKRGLAEDLVIAPYASALALLVAPEAACRNLERLTADGRQGPYGLYEAVDYTPSRLPPGAECVTVRQFMAHHQGMTLLSLAYLLLDKPMQRRFLADPMLRAADLLLQERVPKATAPVFPHAAEARVTRLASAEEAGTMRVFTDPNGPVVEAHLLSNGRYHVAVTTAGGGYSRWRDLAVTRWREDATRDGYGSFCYLRDVDSGALWSNTWQPTTKPTRGYEAIFTQARAEFRRTDEQIETYTQISVSPEEDIELRRVTLTNRSDRPRTIEVTSYAEVVLATQAADEAHPAFSNLFVRTELIRGRQAIYCTRRPRSAEELPPWMTHMMAVRGVIIGEPTYETDRMRFIGRHRTLAAPAALDGQTPLSNTEGPVLDPIVCIRQTVPLQPNEAVRIDLVTGVAESCAGVEALTEKYHDPSLADRVFDLAWTHSHILLQQLSASEADAQIYGRLAGSIIYASASRRAAAGILSRNRKGQSGLWGYGISGDLPIVLLRIRDHERLALVRQAVQAHAYWRLKGLPVDLVIWNEDDSVYRQLLQDTIVDLVAASPEASLVDRPGGVFIRRGEQMSEEDRALLQCVAHCTVGRWWNTGGTGRASWPDGSVDSAPEAGPPPARNARPLRASAARSGVLQRPGRFQPRRPRVCLDPGRRADDARALGERDRQRAIRNRRLRRGQRLYLGGKQPRVSAHPVA